MDKKELNNLIELLRTELNKIIDVAEMDLTQESVLNKSRELDKYLNEYKKTIWITNKRLFQSDCLLFSAIACKIL